MNFQDVLFLDLYHSIRGNWGYDLEDRIKKMQELLPETTLNTITLIEVIPEMKDWEEWTEESKRQKVSDYMKEHLESMLDAAIEKDGFDGRSWARDAFVSYDVLEESRWFDKEFHEKHSVYDLY